jgi:hypothetical protein
VVASTPKPAASKRVLQRLQQSTQQLQLLQSLQVRQCLRNVVSAPVYLEECVCVCVQ